MIKYFRKLIFGFFLFNCTALYGQQVNNDECFIAFNIDNLEDFCSSGFTNLGASQSNLENPTCWLGDNGENDVWYSFIPRQEGLLLRFFGSTSNNEFTIDNTAISIYEGRCNDLLEIQCRSNNPDNEFEQLFSTLVIGRPYYIRISSDRANAGSFQLCLKEFVPVPEPQQDCPEGVVLCDKREFVIEKLESGGLDNDEANGSCIGNPGVPSEVGSVWYKWTALNDGNLTFTLSPNNDDPREDLDFVVYRLPGGINDCANKEMVRCMASGETLNGPNNAPCFGPTGLRAGESDVLETPGCNPGDNNFLAPLDMIAGESYALIVNNFSESGFGFSIEFGGSGEFLGPEADFQFIAIDNFECDKTITFENLSASQTDPIIDYQWRFGQGANPISATGEGPHDVVYESFGPKVAVLTVQSSRGCQVTKVLELEVASCCDDFSQLSLDPEVLDLSCFGSNDGTITANAINGSPEYLYSIDGGSFLPNDIFNGLSIGTYTISVSDIKGCEISQDVSIGQPEEIQLFLTGPTDSIELGEGSQFFSDFLPPDRQLTYMWSPAAGLECIDCPNPRVIPPGTFTYTLTVEDQDGCIQSAEITILTTDFKPFFAPNIMSLNPAGSIDNGFFKVNSNISVDRVEYLAVFDRWGGELYRAENFMIDNPSYIGWDGRVKQSNKKVNPGAYVWVAKVIFIDGDIRTFAGSITVID